MSETLAEEMPIGHADIVEAARRLEGVARKTPLLESHRLNALTGGRVLIKAEPLQHQGSFKLRGAYNAVSRSDAPSVVAFSSGNHAQGVAMAAKLLGKKAIIVMPSDAPEVKRRNTAELGAEVRLFDRYREDRESIAEAIVAETGAALIRSYDDPHVIAGQGTVGLEMVAQCDALGVVPDLAVVCVGGGGLIAGSGLALRHRFPDIALHAAEPLGFDDHARSLVLGERVANPPGAESICDALLAAEPGRLTFAVNHRLLTSGVSVSDDEVRHAMRTAFALLRVVVEPGGAVALAAILAGKVNVAGKTALLTFSGGNVDPGLFAAVLTDGAAADPG